MSQYPEYGTSSSVVPNSSTAIISLIAGILGLTLLPFLGSIVAVITGSMAKKEIAQSAGTLGGEGLATAGTVLGWIGIALGVLGLCIGGIAIGLPLCLTALGLASSEWGSILPVILSII
jgi:hypothetical protein